MGNTLNNSPFKPSQHRCMFVSTRARSTGGDGGWTDGLEREGRGVVGVAEGGVLAMAKQTPPSFSAI